MPDIKIIVDERERGAIRSEFKKLPCAIQIETMPIADYLVGPEFAIERKRGDDLTSSICDNRFFAQMYKMKEHYAQNLIVLENPRRAFSRKNFLDASIYGALMYASFKLKIPVIPTQNEIQTAQVIYSFAKHHQATLPRTFEYVPLEVETGTITRKDQLDLMEGLFKVGRNKAEVLLDTFGSPGKVFQTIIETPLERTAGGKVKGISGPLGELKGFGPNFVITNKRLLQLPFNVSQNLPINLLSKS